MNEPISSGESDTAGLQRRGRGGVSSTQWLPAWQCERTYQIRPLSALGLLSLHLPAASKRDLRARVSHTGAFSGSDQMDSLFRCSNTHGWNVAVCKKKKLDTQKKHTHERTHTLPCPQQFKTRIMMAGGRVSLLSSVVFTLVICKCTLCTKKDTNPPCLNPQRGLVTAI